MGKPKILHEDLTHLLVPPSACLLQPVKAFYEAADFAFFPRFEDSSWHLHVDGFFECHIKVSTLNVNMVNLPILGCGILQYDMHGGHFGCR